MNDNGTMGTARLRQKAAQCRQLAQQALSDGIAIELGKLADDYDANAAELEAFDSERSTARARFFWEVPSGDIEGRTRALPITHINRRS